MNFKSEFKDGSVIVNGDFNLTKKYMSTHSHPLFTLLESMNHSQE